MELCRLCEDIIGKGLLALPLSEQHRHTRSPLNVAGFHINSSRKKGKGFPVYAIGGVSSLA
jgi:hypothetical protein